MLIEGFLDNTLRERLGKFPNLMSFVDCFNENEGISERAGFLPNLVIWFRRKLNEAGIEYVDSYFGWDEDTAEDFYSWGHNSRWNHTFRTELEGDLEFYTLKAVELAEKYGDVESVDELYKTPIRILDLPTRSKNALSKIGIKYLEDVYNYTELSLINNKGIGIKALTKIRQILESRGMSKMDKGV